MISEKININNIVIDLNASDKKSVVEKLSKLLETNGFVSDHKQFQKDVFDRENHMTTGIGKNIAIPHGKSLAVIESTVAVAKLKRSVEWGALDDQPVDLVFLLAIKDTDKGTNHLRILAELSGRLMDDEFVKRIKDSRNKKELHMTKIVAVTACIAGIAHTYMAKANLEKFAKKKGLDIKVETQGAMGIENKLSISDVSEADVVIFAVDTNVSERGRFDGKPILTVGTSEVVKDGEETIDEAIALINK